MAQSKNKLAATDLILVIFWIALLVLGFTLFLPRSAFAASTEDLAVGPEFHPSDKDWKSYASSENFGQPVKVYESKTKPELKAVHFAAWNALNRGETLKGALTKACAILP